MTSKITEHESVNLESGPPAYGQGNFGDIPPKYLSVIAQIKKAQMTSGSKKDFASSSCKIVTETIGFTVANAILLAIPVAMITVGALNLNNCPVERFIPIWMIVAGSVSAIIQLASIVDNLRKKCGNNEDEEEDKTNNNQLKPHTGILSCFNFAWFIAGNVWVYRIYAPQTSNPALDNYCDHSTYYFAFWVMTSTYIFAALALCCCCTICCFMCRGVAGATTETKDLADKSPIDEGLSAKPLDQ